MLIRTGQFHNLACYLAVNIILTDTTLIINVPGLVKIS